MDFLSCIRKFIEKFLSLLGIKPHSSGTTQTDSKPPQQPTPQAKPKPAPAAPKKSESEKVEPSAQPKQPQPEKSEPTPPQTQTPQTQTPQTQTPQTTVEDSSSESDESKIEIFAPCNGVLVDQKDIADETFAEGHMGDGLGIVPTDGRFTAFMEGELVVLYKTKHAYFIKEPKSGVNVMLHIGINTVEIDASKQAFTTSRNLHDILKQHDSLCEANLEVIKAEDKDTTTSLLIQKDEGMEGRKIIYNKKPGDTVSAGEVVMTIVSES